MIDATQGQPEEGSDPDLDRAILAHDAVRTNYILRNRAVRRIMGVLTFAQWAAGNAAIILAGLVSDDIARRIGALASVIGTWEMSSMGIIAMYWGAGAFDNRSMMGGSMYGSSMYGGYNSFSSFGASSPLGDLSRPHLTKNPAPAAPRA